MVAALAAPSLAAATCNAVSVCLCLCVCVGTAGKVSAAITGVEAEEVEEKKSASTRRRTPVSKKSKLKQLRRRVSLYSHTICARISARSGVRTDDGNVGGVDALQRRVLLLLGKLGGLHKGVVGTVQTHLSRSIAWDTSSRLPLAFPLNNEKVCVRACVRAVAMLFRFEC